ncbi:inhibitor of nuclear factor kappa-B kinase subunit beta isoform X1 [Ciona intestinalis]
MLATRPSQRQPMQCGEWTLVKILGSGGFGQVSLWKNKQDVKLAVKQCKNQLSKQNERRWRKEVEMMQSLNHPSIVNFVEVPVEIQNAYVDHYIALGMEYCEAGDLRKFLTQPENCCGLPEFQVRNILQDIGSAIEHLHERQLVHRDLKPENIVMKEKEKNVFQFKIIDLGYAKEINENSFGTSFVGTMHYLAPEFYGANSLCYTATVDFWSFGLLVFECITGRRPFFPSLELAQVLNDLKEKKRYEHICTVESQGSTHVYSSTIPQPHSLNPIFAKKIESWLQQMLQLDPQLRGGGVGNNEWFKTVERIIREKCIHIYNTQNNSVFTIPVLDERMSITKMQEAIMRGTNIPIPSQILLLKDGKKPDVRYSAVSECWKKPDHHEWLIFLFSCTGTYQRYQCALPKEIGTLIIEPRAPLRNPQQRRVLSIATNCVRREALVCRRSIAALATLSESIERHTNYYEQQLKSFSDVFNMFRGKVEFFKFSIEKDISNCIETEICDNNELLNQRQGSWYDQLSLVNRHREQTCPTIQNMLKNCAEPYRIREHIKLSKEIVAVTTKKCDDWENEAKKKYSLIKNEIRKIEADIRTNHETDVNALQHTMRDLVMNFIPKTLEELTTQLAKIMQCTKILVEWHEWINERLPQIGSSLQNLGIQSKDLMDCQARRQTEIFESMSQIQTEVRLDNETVQQQLQDAEEQVGRECEGRQQTQQEMGNHVCRLKEMIEGVTSDDVIKQLKDLNDVFSSICEENNTTENNIVPHILPTVTTLPNVSQTPVEQNSEPILNHQDITHDLMALNLNNNNGTDIRNTDINGSSVEVS